MIAIRRCIMPHAGVCAAARHLPRALRDALLRALPCCLTALALKRAQLPKPPNSLASLSSLTALRCLTLHDVFTPDFFPDGAVRMALEVSTLHHSLERVGLSCNMLEVPPAALGALTNLCHLDLADHSPGAPQELSGGWEEEAEGGCRVCFGRCAGLHPWACMAHAVV